MHREDDRVIFFQSAFTDLYILQYLLPTVRVRIYIRALIKLIVYTIYIQICNKHVYARCNIYIHISELPSHCIYIYTPSTFSNIYTIYTLYTYIVYTQYIGTHTHTRNPLKTLSSRICVGIYMQVHTVNHSFYIILCVCLKLWSISPSLISRARAPRTRLTQNCLTCCHNNITYYIFTTCNKYTFFLI